MDILREYHYALLTKLCSTIKMLELISWNYWFPGVNTSIRDYTNSCHLCQQVKALHYIYHRELTPILVFNSPSKGLFYNLITDLLVSNSMNSIISFIDQMTKMSHFITCLKFMSASEFTYLFISYIIKLHGLLNSIISDYSSISYSISHLYFNSKDRSLKVYCISFSNQWLNWTNE